MACKKKVTGSSNREDTLQFRFAFLCDNCAMILQSTKGLLKRLITGDEKWIFSVTIPEGEEL